MAEVDFKAIEKKWQDKWEEEEVFHVLDFVKDKKTPNGVTSSRPKYYVLEMFPYPSGEGLHMGHALNYTIGDIYARFKRMQGFNVLYPMGYDALGLPAENAAIKVNIHPENYTNKSISNFIKQQKLLGLSYDWSRMINTASPSYYKWDQWIFLKMLEKKIAYRKKAPVNWCSKCKSVLANEQVHDGKCWRHEDTKVEIKHLEQWFFKITNYADELLDKTDELDWPQRTKVMQKNWIGKSYGTEIIFKVNGKKWPIFTTRPDTIYGVTFMVISAQHPELMELVSKHDVKRVCIDPISVFAMHIDRESEIRERVFELGSLLKRLNVTVILSDEETTEDSMSMITPSEITRTNALRFTTDSVTVLHSSGLGGIEDRAVRIMKMRRTAHARGPVPMQITNAGIKVTAQ